MRRFRDRTINSWSSLLLTRGCLDLVDVGLTQPNAGMSFWDFRLPNITPDADRPIDALSLAPPTKTNKYPSDDQLLGLVRRDPLATVGFLSGP